MAQIAKVGVTGVPMLGHPQVHASLRRTDPFRGGSADRPSASGVFALVAIESSLRTPPLVLATSVAAHRATATGPGGPAVAALGQKLPVASVWSAPQADTFSVAVGVRPPDPLTFRFESAGPKTAADG
jgi:hypothetical protein